MKRIVNIGLGDGGPNGLFNAFTYPAGELQVRLTEAGVKAVSEADDIRIVAVIQDAQGIMGLLLLRDAIQNVRSDQSTLSTILPYLPYGRADRRFCAGDCHGLKVFRSLLPGCSNGRSMGDVFTLDAHSPECWPIKSVSPLPLISQAIVDFARTHDTKSVTVLYPDQGASRRYEIPSQIGCNTEVISVNFLHCEKKRDPETGRFLGFQVPDRGSFSQDTPVLIVDDICDGGGTFVGIADAMKEYRLTLGLYVTHGIFSKGLKPLTSKFSHIFTTDSLVVSPAKKLTVYKSLPLLFDAVKAQNVE